MVLHLVRRRGVAPAQPISVPIGIANDSQERSDKKSFICNIIGTTSLRTDKFCTAEPCDLKSVRLIAARDLSRSSKGGEFEHRGGGWNDTRSAVSSVVDSRGNSYILAVGPTLGSALTQSIYYAKNIAGGNNTVTVTFNQTAAYPDVRVLEYSGADPTNPLDVTAAAMGNSKSPSSSPAAITTSSELIFGAGMTFDAFSGPGSGFNNRIITNFGDIAEDATVLSMGSYSATAPLRSSAPWVMQMATFRGRQGVSGTPAPALTSISPNSGPTSGGSTINIQGTGFQIGATVSLGGTAATNVIVGSSTSITATVAPHAAGPLNVVVTNTDGQTGTLANGYTYSAATSGTISFVQGKSASLTSGSSVAITYSIAQTAGNLNVVSVMWGDRTSVVSSVTDSQGNSYALAAGPAMATALTSAIYYARTSRAEVTRSQ